MTDLIFHFMELSFIFHLFFILQGIIITITTIYYELFIYDYQLFFINQNYIIYFLVFFLIYKYYKILCYFTLFTYFNYII